MHHLNPSKVAVAFGILFGGWHVMWSLLIVLGWAQPILDFVFWAHMLSQPFVVQAFDFTAAVTLIILTTAIGYVAGYFFALVWNRAHRGA